MNKYFTTLLLFVSIAHFSFSQYTVSYYINNPHPTYEEVYNKFYKTYDVPEGTNIIFQKKPDGWNIQSESSNGKKTEMFWSFKSRWYKELSFDKNMTGKISTPYNSRLHGAYDYEKNLFYGYTEWGKDVISILKNEKELPDDYLNSLARAYAFEASQIVAPYGKFQQGWNKYDEAYDKNVFSESDIQSFIDFMYLDIKTYKRLIKQNPFYESFVGNIKLKCWDEYMYAYMSLLFIDQKEQAQQFIEPELFDDFFISVAKSMLNSCEPNGILIVGGDNDTYPLIYVQDKFNYRQDVTIINSSLSNLGRYTHYLTSIKKNIKTTLQDKDYSYLRNELLILIEECKGKTISAEKMINEIKSGNLIYTTYGDDSYSKLPADKIKFETKGFEKNASTISTEYFNRLPYITINISDEYQRKSALFFMDMLYSNNWERPVYISSTMSKSDEAIRYFEPFMILEGLHYRIAPYEKKEKKYDEELVNFIKGKDFFEKQFIIEGIDSNASKFKGVNDFVSLFRNDVALTANEMLYKGKDDEVVKWLDRINAKMPSEYIPWDETGIDIAKIYYAVGAEDKGAPIYKSVLQNEKDNFDRVYSICVDKDGKLNYDHASYEDRKTLYIYYKLNDFAETFFIEDLKKSLQKYKLKEVFE